MPGGHLATSVILGAGAYATSGSAELALGCFTGGFLIDVDHYLDYLLFERQWMKPAPSQFLRYYFTNQPRLLVLPLHSYELMTVLFVLALLFRPPLLIGYLLGALMHLGFDIAINGDYALRHRFLFYSFGYRAALNFRADVLLDVSPVPAETGTHPYREFLSILPPGALHKGPGRNPTVEPRYLVGEPRSGSGKASPEN
jgi:hypothetical protein